MTLKSLLKLRERGTTATPPRAGRNCKPRVTAALIAGLAISAFWSPPASADPAVSIRILALGDSLTAGYGLDDLKDAFPAQLERALRAKGHANVTVVPAGISGDTTTGGVSRLEWSLATKPDAVIVALGGNDGLRGIDPKLTEDNLRTMVARIRKDGTPVLLAGMLAPPNLGRDYGARFAAAFATVAKETGVLFYPFFLDGVAGDPKLNQADRIHPTPQGVAVIVARILPTVEKLVAQAETRPRAK
jgi:acyl-CoA thioesterase-1